MDIKKLLIVIVILALIYVLVISLIPKKLPTYNAPKINEPSLVRLTCDQKCSQDKNCLESCYYIEINRAVIGRSIGLCNEVSVLIKQTCIDNVNLQKALDANDKSLCDQIISQNIKQSCLNSLQ